MDRYAKTGRYPKAIVPVALYGMQPRRVIHIRIISIRLSATTTVCRTDAASESRDQAQLGLCRAARRKSPKGLTSAQASVAGR